MFEAAHALGLPVKLHAEQLSDSGGAALAAEFGALSCEHLEYLSEAGVAAMAKAGTRRRAAARRLLFPARDASCRRSRRCAPHGVPIAIATDHNPGSSPTLSPLLMLNMACTLFRLTPEEAAARHDGERRPCPRPARPRHAGGRADGPTSSPGTSSIRTSCAYWFGHNPCARVIAGGKRAGAPSNRASRSSRLHRGSTPAALISLPHVGTEIPAALQAAAGRARRSAVEDTDWHLEQLYAFARELGAGMLVPRHSRYVIDLNRPPENTPMYAGANNTELCPTRFFSGERALSATRAGARRGRDRAAPRRLLAALPRRARRRARAARRPSTATRSCGTGTASSRAALAVRGRLPDLNLGTAGGASCAPGLRAALMAGARARRATSATSPTAASRAGTSPRHYGQPQRGIHAIQLEMCWSCYMAEEPPYVIDPARAKRLQPVLRDLLQATLDWKRR